MKSGKILGIGLLSVGVIFLLAQLGINIGWIIGLAISIFLLINGWKIYKGSTSGGKKFLAILMMGVGIMILVNMIHIIIGLAIAGFLIYKGYQILKTKKHQPVIAYEGSYMELPETMEDELDRWEKELKKI